MTLDYEFSQVVKTKPINASSGIIEDFNDNNHGKNSEKYSEEVTTRTPIQKFYENQSIFITGGTGFLGKVLIEKLLRSCPKISQIFVLIRQKKGKKAHERIQELLQDSVFDNSRSSMKNFENKIYGVTGDCNLPNLDLSYDDAQLLKEKVSIVFHLAATVRFDEKLKQAVATNICSTESVVDLCKQMKNLKSFVHVSTIYSNCFTSDIEEKLYDYPVDRKQLVLLVNKLSEKSLTQITPHLIQPWPNTYTLTKALAEDLVRKECTNLPVAIFRPGAVSSSAFEPTPGWTDINYNGLTGAIAGVASGLLRTVQCDPTLLTSLIPVDLTVNALIACAWNVTVQTNRRGDNMLVYNFTSSNDAPITWETIAKKVVKYVDKYPFTIGLWCPFLQTTKNKYLSNLYKLFLHLIPAYVIDFGLYTVGQKPKLLEAYKKIDRMINVTRHFLMRPFHFKNDNVKNLWDLLDVRDQELFPFSMLNFDWDEYFSNYVKGVRVFLFKDDLKTLETSRKKHMRFHMIQRLVVTSLIGFVCWLLWKLLLILL